jgi:3-methyladenine DNA glycosylase AlkC
VVCTRETGILLRSSYSPPLEVFTRSTAEFAIRPFIRKFPKKTMTQMWRWARHPDERVRRLASEGSRPRLPWGTALEEFKRDPSPILPVLELLKDDPSETVTRSVANNLNDIARDHPDVALDVAESWLKGSSSRRPLLKHALRGLLKKGDPWALALFELETGVQVRVTKLQVTPRRVPLGGRCAFEAVVVSDEPSRKHYPGPHTLSLVVNGERKRAAHFSLVRVR